jgi:hypothetical protein
MGWEKWGFERDDRVLVLGVDHEHPGNPAREVKEDDAAQESEC